METCTPGTSRGHGTVLFQSLIEVHDANTTLLRSLIEVHDANVALICDDEIFP